MDNDATRRKETHSSSNSDWYPTKFLEHEITTVRTDLILSQSAFSHVVDVEASKINIAKWLSDLPDAEYQRCAPPDHIASGATWTDDGKRMSINVEMIGTGLVVQHYVAEVADPLYCTMVSISDVFTPHGRTKVQVIWELSAKALPDGKTEYTNSGISHPTDDFLAFIENNGMTFEQASQARQEASGEHNRRETPLFAESIARAAKKQNGASDAAARLVVQRSCGPGVDWRTC